MTDADLIKVLRCCSEDRCPPCEDCPLQEERRGVETHEVCDDYIMRLAAERLEELTGGQEDDG
jgi:hypothetical protein